jgi:mono/diheme cytochrome c family protein
MRSLGAAGLLGLGLVALSGCDAEYPVDLKYAPRTEPIVADTISSIPSQIDRPGQMFQILAGLEEKDKKSILDPANLKADLRRKLESMLDNVFGTPRHPQVQEIEPELRSALKLDDKTLEEGSMLYRLHCLHCHGVPGNGRGPTAPWVNPHPRDYRQGMFKFTSTLGGKDRKPRREDLLRTLHEGVEGTTMPSFALLPSGQLEALASYVTHLSMRGEVEFNVMKDYLRGTQEESDFEERVKEWLAAVAGSWGDATKEDKIIRPEAGASLATGERRKTAVANGFRLFKSTTDAGCIGCHIDYGRRSNYFYDDWGTIGRPADLTTGIYRGGRRPIDLFWRIHSGVSGSNMPAFNASLKTQDIWDLVSFMQVLPYKKMRQEYGVVID